MSGPSTEPFSGATRLRTHSHDAVGDGRCGRAQAPIERSRQGSHETEVGIGRTPDRPRAFSDRQNATQPAPSSAVLTSMLGISRSTTSERDEQNINVRP